MKHNMKRALSVLLAVLMCLSMLTGIVLPAAAETTEPAVDAYAAIEAIDNGDGTWTPGKAVFVYKDAPASGDTTYKYGDGITWGNGKTYKLVGGVTAFSKMNAAIHYIEAQWNAYDGPYSAYTGPDTVVVAPGEYGSSSWQNNKLPSFNLPKDDQGNTIENPAYYELFTYTVLGPQAGKDPTPKTKEAIANGILSNNRGFTKATEAISTSTLWMPLNAQIVIDGWAFRGSHNFHDSSKRVSVVMSNIVYRHDTIYSNGLYRYSSATNNINIEFHNYAVEYTQVASATVKDELSYYLSVARLIFDNYYEYGGKLQFVSDENIQAHMLNYYPTPTANLLPNFLGEGNNTAIFSMTNSTISHNRTAHWIRTRMANTSTTKDDVTTVTRDYSANAKNSVYFEVKNNYFYNVGDWCGTDVVKIYKTDENGEFILDAKGNKQLDHYEYDGVGNGDKANLIDVFSFQDTWNLPDGAMKFVLEGNTIEYTADCLSRHSSGTMNGLVMLGSNAVLKQDFNYKNNTLIMPEGYNGMNDSFSFSENATLFDRSSLLVLNENNEVMAAPGKNNEDKINDVYAGDDFMGGIAEMFTVQTAKDMAFNNVINARREDKTGVNPVTASIVLVPYASESAHDAKDLFTFRGDKVEFVGIYKDGKEITSAKPSELDGCTMVASYKGKTTICKVTYTIRVATESDMVFVDAANSATSYTFNGKTYTLSGSNRVATFENAVKANKLFWVLLPGTYNFVGGNPDRIYNTRVTILGPKMGVSPLDENNNLDLSNRAISGSAVPYTVDTTKEAVIGGAVTVYGSQGRLMIDGVVANDTFQFSPSTNATEDWGLATGGSLIGVDANNVFVNNAGTFVVGYGSNSDKKDNANYMGKSLATYKPKVYLNVNNSAFCDNGYGMIASSSLYDINLDHVYVTGTNSSILRTHMPSGILMDMSPMEGGITVTNSKFENCGVTNDNWIYGNYTEATQQGWGYSPYCNGETFPAGITQRFENNTFINLGKYGCQTKGYALRLSIPNQMDNAKIIFKNNTVLEDEACTYRMIDSCGDRGYYLSEGNAEITGNVFINLKEPIRLGQNDNQKATVFSLDENYFGAIENGEEVVKKITAATNVTKSDWYYVDREMTKSVDITKFDLLKGDFDGIKLINTATANFNATVDVNTGKVYDITKAFVANGGKVGTVTLKSGNGTLNGNKYTPANGDVLTVPVTVDDYTINWTVTVNDIWGKYGLAPVNGETFVDITTQEKYEARANAHLNSGKADLIFVAPDWKTYAYKDAALTQKVADDATLLEDAASNTKLGNNREMKVGTEFYAEMPTTGIVYKLTYGVTAADFYHANICKAGTIVAFPGLYNFGSSYQSGVGLYHSGDNNDQITIGIPQAATDFTEILFLGPQAGKSAANTANGTSNGRTLDSATEAIIDNRGVYIMNRILGDGDELIFDGLAVTNGTNFYYFYGNGDFQTKYNNDVTFSFDNVLFDNYSTELFKFRHTNDQNGVGSDYKVNQGKLTLTLNFNDTYLNAGAKTGWLTLGKVQADQIHFDRCVILNNQKGTANDNVGFYINPTTGANNPKKHLISYTCDNSYIDSRNSYLFGVYFNGTTGLTTENRDGIEIRFDNNIMIDQGIHGAGNNNSRDPIYQAFSPTKENLAMTDIQFTNNTVTLSDYPTNEWYGSVISPGDGTYRSADVSGNVFVGYGVKNKLFQDGFPGVDLSDNAFFDLDGTTPIAPIFHKAVQKTDVVLNRDLTAKISDYNIASGATQKARFTWANNGTNIYTQIAPQAQATLAYAEGMTLDSIKAGIAFESDNVTVKSLTGDVQIGGTLTMVATHALTGKDVSFKIGLTGKLADAIDLKDTAYADRDYFDPSVAGMADGTPVARTAVIDGELKSIQFTVGENIFGVATAIPVIDKQRDVYLLPITYTAIGFGADGERNVMNYLHGAQEGITGVVDNDKDGIPDAKNPARADLTKETVINTKVGLGYHAEVTVDGVTFGAAFKIESTSGDWGVTSLETIDIAVINSVSNGEALPTTTNYFIKNNDTTHRINLLIENTEITMSEASKGNVIEVYGADKLLLNNNIIDCGDGGDVNTTTPVKVLVYNVRKGGDNKTSAAGQQDVDITNNRLRGSLLFQRLSSENNLPLDINVKGNVIEGSNNNSTVEFDSLLDGYAVDLANSSIVFDGNVFTTVDTEKNVRHGNYIWLDPSAGAEAFTMVFKNNTFVRTATDGANYAFAFLGGYTLDASENNIFDGFLYNCGDHTTGLWNNVVRVQDGYYIPILSNGDKHSYMVIDGVKYAADHVSETFTVADLFSDKAVVDTVNKTVKEFVDPAAANYMLSTGDGMMAKAIIGGKTYYNAFPITTGGTTTATVQLTKINGEAVGDVYTVTFVPDCDHSNCYADVEPDKKVDATCVDGYAEYTCPLNGDKFTVVLKGDGKHTFSVEVEGTKVEATCSAAGSVTMRCANCEATEVKTLDIDPGAHKWNDGYTIDLPATCYTEGAESIHCSLCTATKDSKAIPATGDHNPADEWTQGEETHYHACTTNGCPAKLDEVAHTESDVIEITAPQIGIDGVGKTECTVCGKVLKDNVLIPAMPAPVLSGVNIGDKNYASLAAALEDAKAGDVITLNENIAVESYVTVDPDVTIDLNGKTLTVDYFVGFKGSALIDSDENNTGKLIVDKNKVALDAENNGYLPVYDGNGYIFTTVKMAGRTGFFGDIYAFSPIFEASAHEALMSGFENSNVNVVIRLTWTNEGNYEAKQDYIYMDEMVDEVVRSYDEALKNYKKAFSAKFDGNEAGNVDNVVVSAVIISETGVEIMSTPINL